jgi:hypothetical protein
MEQNQPGADDASASALDQLARLFPTVAPADVQAVWAGIPLLKKSRLLSGEEIAAASLLSPDCQLAIPCRVYFQEPAVAVEQQLTSQQRQLLGCLYLRHHDGFVRQRRLAQLLTASVQEPFTTPFTFSLLGDYVQEILETLAAHLTPALLVSYVELIRENPRYWSQTQGRVASYWDIYYRTTRQGTSQFRHYVGSRLLKKLREAVRQTAFT